MVQGTRRSSVRMLTVGLILALAAAVLPQSAGPALALPSGFTETTAFSGLTNPVKVVFANDGRVFVAEKSGFIKVFDSLTDATASVVADLRTNVYDNWDRGLLGFTLHPDFPTTPYAYVLYTYDHILGDPAPPPKWNDLCADQLGNGCVASGRLSRLQIAGSQMTGSEQPFIEDWCIQYPSHATGDLRFGSDGMLYVSAGDGASFSFNDYGQDGDPLNPCGDPPGGVGATLTLPTAEGGSLRSQDIRTSGDPQGFDGTILRLDPLTGAAAAGNPLIGNADPNVRRIIATGLRNPFKTTIRPGTNEIWAGDVGQGGWEEIDRIDWSSGMKNLGWPCYEGAGKQGGFDAANVNICENLYAAGPSAVTAPYFTYQHGQKVAGESCGTGSSSISGLAFYSGTSYPSAYPGSLFFSDYSRDCIWVMFRGGNGLPDPTNIVPFHTPASNPVDLEIGPNGDLFYVDFGTNATTATDGRVMRITYQGTGNQAPTAVATATPQSGPAPLTVAFSASGSSDPNGDALSYAWDLDGDGAYDDSSSPTPSYIYSNPGSVTVGLRATDTGGLSGTTTVVVTATSGSGTLRYLSDLSPTFATNGYGPYERDTSNGEDLAGDGNPIRLGSTTYPKGLGVHAASDLRYALGGTCTNFAADVGLDEEVGTAGSVIFQVLTDGTQRYLSPALTGASATQALSIDVTGSQELRLVVQTNGIPDFDHADWAGARITCGSTNRTPTAVASAIPSSGPAPLAVNFSGLGSSDPDGDTLTYAWDLDGDGAYDDATSATPSRTYSAGNVTVGLRVTDPGGLAATTTVVVTATSGGSLTYLSDMTPTSATNGWGPYERDMSNGEIAAGDGNPIRLGATTYAKGLGVHADSDLRFALGGACTSFAADIGLDEEVGINGSVVFQVFTDGTQRYASSALTGASTTQSVSVDVTGRQELRLVVLTNGVADFDHADWAGARVTCGSTNLPPTAVASANPTSGQAPLTVAFSASGSSDPEAGPLTYAWDLDADGAYDDATSATPSFTYTTAGTRNVGLRVTDNGGLTDTDTVTVTVTAPNDLPVPVITAPTALLTWAVGDRIAFAGSATDDEDGALAPAALTWTLIMQHCAPDGTCHSHQIEQYPGIDQGSFTAPDHEYPSHLELRLTATDSAGGSASTSVELEPKTVDLTFESLPDSGLQIVVANVTGTTPFTRTVIVNGRTTASAVTPQTVGPSTYTFQSWSDGGAQSHEITAPAASATYAATFTRQTRVTFTPTADAHVRSTQPTRNYGATKTLQVRANTYRSYLRFTVSGLTGTTIGAKLRLRVTDGSASPGRLYVVSGGWTEAGITWNNAPAIVGTPIATLGPATAGTWLEVDVSTLVTANGTYDLAISDGNSDTSQYASREAANKPELVVTVAP